MPWKRENGEIVIGESGNPVYVYPGGDEIEYDADEQVKKIRQLTTKSAKRKETIQSLEATNAVFAEAGIDTSDPESISEFLSTAKENKKKVDNFNKSDLVNASKVEEIKLQVAQDYDRKLENQKSSYEKKLSEANDTIKTKDKAIKKSIINSAFSRSKFIREKTGYPTTEIAYKDLKNYFDVEEVNGNMVGFGLDSDGNKLYSLKSPTEYASLDEAIELVVNNHPQRDHLILVDGGGSGTNKDKKTKTIAGQKVIDRSDKKAFGDNLADIASGKAKVQ